MSSFGRSVGCSLVLLAAGAVTASGQGETARGVSPGASERVAEATGACPTFSWSAVAGATAYRLALFETLPDGRVEAVYSESIAGAASSWTPPRERCLVPGREYAWVVRAERGNAEALGPWSSPLRFRVPGAPSAEELAAALAVLERWRAAGGEGRSGQATGSAEGRVPSEASRGSVQAEASTATGVAAIRGEIADVTGNAYGVFGISHSPQGAGVVARNETAGADLILDGEAQGQADTLLTQSGIDRPSASAQTFEIGNSGAGAMTLTVDGVAVDTATTPLGWTRLTGVPAGFADGIDNDTTYTAGNQLSLAGAQFNVLDGPGSGLDADTLDGAQGSSYQARITGICAEGEAMQGVNPDGTVICTLLTVASLALVDRPVSHRVGEANSMARGPDGFPVISNVDATAHALKVAKCNDPACAGGLVFDPDETITIVDDSVWVLDTSTSIATGADGFPVISYGARNPNSLRVVKCNDAACTGGDESRSTIDSSPTEYLGEWSSLAVGVDGNPVVAYFDPGLGALKVAKCNDIACAGNDETITVVDDPPNVVGHSPSIALDASGFPTISYYDWTAGDLKLAKCNDPACSGGDETLSTVDGSPNDVGLHSSLALPADGFPVISYWDVTDNSIKMAKCNDAACAGNDESIVTLGDSLVDSQGQYNGIAVSLSGNPVVAYSVWPNGILRLVACNDPACAGGDESFVTLDSRLTLFHGSMDLMVGLDGAPIVSFFEESVGALWVVRCANPDCAR